MSAWSNTDTNLSKPSWTKTGNRNLSNANTYGVSTLEKSQTANASSFSKSAAHQGWVKIIPQYTDSSGNIRRKAETLVVIGATITGNANNQLAGTVNTTTGSVNVVGTNTRFTTEVKVGDVLNIGPGTSLRVATLVNASFLTVNTAASGNTNTQNVWVGDSAWFPLT